MKSKSQSQSQCLPNKLSTFFVMGSFVLLMCSFSIYIFLFGPTSLETVLNGNAYDLQRQEMLSPTNANTTNIQTIDLEHSAVLLKERTQRRKCTTHTGGAHEKLVCYLAENNASRLTANSFKFDSSNSKFRLIDVILFNDEWDMLSFRLSEHNDLMALTVISEWPSSFSGLPKPLHLQNLFYGNPNVSTLTEPQQNVLNFFLNGSIVLSENYEMENLIGLKNFKFEWPLRAMALQFALDFAKEMTQFSETHGNGDNEILIYQSDVDEVLNVKKVGEFLKAQNATSRCSPLLVRMPMFKYSMNCDVQKSWLKDRLFIATLADVEIMVQSNISEGGPHPLGDSSCALEESGWHLSSIYNSVEKIRTKLAAYSHSNDRNILDLLSKSDDEILSLMNNCTNWWGWKSVKINTSDIVLPRYFNKLQAFSLSDK